MTMSVITRHRLMEAEAHQQATQASAARHLHAAEPGPNRITTHADLVAEEAGLVSRRAITGFWTGHGYTKVAPLFAIEEPELTKMSEEMTLAEYEKAFGHLNAAHIHRDAYGRFWAKAPVGKKLENGAKGTKADLSIRERQPNMFKRGTVFTFKMTWGAIVFGFDMVAELFFAAGQAVAIFLTPPVWLAWNIVNAGLRGFSYIWKAINPRSERAERLMHAARRVNLLEAASEMMFDVGLLSLLPSWIFQPIVGRVSHTLRKMKLYEFVVSLDNVRGPGQSAHELYQRNLDRLAELDAKINERQETVAAVKTSAKARAKGIVDEMNGEPTVRTTEVFKRLSKESMAYAKAKSPRTRSRLYGVHRAIEAVTGEPKVVSNVRVRNRVRAALRAEVLPRNSGFMTTEVLRGFDNAIKQLTHAEGQIAA